MTDVNRYITDEAVYARIVLRAALPGILAQHRADVLREAAEKRALFCSRYPMCPVADEAVPNGR